MTSAQTTASSSRPGVTAKGKVRPSEEMARPLNRTQAIATPISAPGMARSSDSTITEITTAVPPKPMARRVAISRARASTAEYMVLTAPNTAPTAITTPMK